LFYLAGTLIRLLIELFPDRLNAGFKEYFPTPVVGMAGHDIPTSADVHLYMDPYTSESQAPILYADCEGIGGGEREPLAAVSRKRAVSDNINSPSSSLPSRSISFANEPYRARELQWLDSDEKGTRNFAVRNLYPRLLFAFSDIVVYVLRNPR
jgi:hypothetical protein